MNLLYHHNELIEVVEFVMTLSQCTAHVESGFPEIEEMVVENISEGSI